MENFDAILRDLQAQMVRKNQLESRKRSLLKQREALEEKERTLKDRRISEQADVDRLGRRSLASLFFALTGQKAERLDREQREAYEAAVRHDAAVRELESVNDDLDRTARELMALSGCERRYAQVLEQKKAAMRSSGTVQGERVIALEKAIAECAAIQKELKEAVQAGNRARNTAEAILKELGSAESWGTWDMLGGGLITDLAKHDHLDSAQSLVETLQIQLGRFKTELADVSVYADLKVNIEGFTRFADYFFDDLFSAWAVLDRIGQSKAQVEQVRSRLSEALRRLNTLEDEAAKTSMRLQGELNALVID